MWQHSTLIIMSEDNEFHKIEAHEFMNFHCTLWRNGKPIQDSVASHGRWLCQGKVLVWLFTMWNEVMLFLSELLFNLQEQVAATFVLSHWYFSSLSELNQSLQGTSVTVVSAYDKIEAKLKKKNPLLEILCDKRNYRVLPYISWLFAWIKNSSYVRNRFRINKK
jgi:hypothetical protein